MSFFWGTVLGILAGVIFKFFVVDQHMVTDIFTQPLPPPPHHHKKASYGSEKGALYLAEYSYRLLFWFFCIQHTFSRGTPKTK